MKNWATGEGYIALDWAVTVLLWLAVVMQTAQIRDRSICESAYATSCRWLVDAGIAGIASRFAFVLWERGDINLPPFSLLSLAFLSIGMIGAPLDRMMHRSPCRRSEDKCTLEEARRGE